jgi:formylglycine-generating enzyme required for sulfatase activity
VIHSTPGDYELVWIPAGSFMMGAREDDPGAWGSEQPQHRVELDGFYLGRFPVTNGEYARFLAANWDVRTPSYWEDERLNGPELPVVGVDWHEAGRYAAWAGLRLPTEAEWEYAATVAATRLRRDARGQVVLRRGIVNGPSQRAAALQADASRVHNMIGCLSEWCSDWGDRGHSYYAVSPLRNPKGPSTGEARVLRGSNRRATWRFAAPPDVRTRNCGFRCARAG